MHRAKRPVGGGVRIPLSRLRGSRVLGFGLLRHRFDGTRFLNAACLPGERHEKRQQRPQGYPGHGPGIRR